MTARKKTRTAVNTKASSRVGYFIRRILAFGLDYLIVNRVCIMATALVYGMMNHGEVIILSDLSSVPLPQCAVILAVIFIITLLYFVYIPYHVWKGQTLVQHVFQLKMVNEDHEDVDLKTQLKRFIIGCLLLEGTFYYFTSVLKNVVILKFLYSNPETMDWILSGPILLLSAYSLISSVLDKKQSRTLHDRIFHTEVIDIYDGTGHAL
ncbi:MAG: RDD family protein [Erysipelotrichaceae bacterium]|jgi:uncharacterized RDD family membrane protein YckC|nr:RDD family protein [Erysipelotrichaceae bacterium]